MNRNAAFGVGALLGAAAALAWNQRTRVRVVPAAPETRRQELREKLAGAQPAEAPAPTPEEAAPPKPPDPPPPPPPPPAAETRGAPPPRAPGPPPADEFEAMRRRIHEEGKAAAEEMRQAPDPKS